MFIDTFLAGAEAELFGEAAHRLIDDIRTCVPRVGCEVVHQHQIGVEMFDNLTWEQKFILIDQVLAFVLDQATESPPRAAYWDSTVAAIFAQMLAEVEVEIDNTRLGDEQEDPTKIREMVLDAVLCDQDYPRDTLPPADSIAHEDWQALLDTLSDRLLPDEDWKMANVALDLPPSTGNPLKEKMGISPDYFSAVPPDATREEARKAWMSIYERLNGKPIAEWRFGDGSRAHVMLEQVIEAIELTPEDWAACLIKETCKICIVPEELFGVIEGEDPSELSDSLLDDDILAEAKELAENDYVELPEQREINEWEIMQRFSRSREQESARDELLNAIHGAGAFRLFRREIERLNMVDDWYRFREEELEEFVVDWLEANNIQWLRESDLAGE